MFGCHIEESILAQTQVHLEARIWSIYGELKSSLLWCCRISQICPLPFVSLNCNFDFPMFCTTHLCEERRDFFWNSREEMILHGWAFEMKWMCDAWRNWKEGDVTFFLIKKKASREVPSRVYNAAHLIMKLVIDTHLLT